jgi:hypothetical protein
MQEVKLENPRELGEHGFLSSWCELKPSERRQRLDWRSW